MDTHIFGVAFARCL